MYSTRIILDQPVIFHHNINLNFKLYPDEATGLVKRNIFKITLKTLGVNFTIYHEFVFSSSKKLLKTLQNQLSLYKSNNYVYIHTSQVDLNY